MGPCPGALVHATAIRSSTQCELVALSLVAKLRPAPSLVLTDSLVSLQLIQSWGRRPIAEVIACPDRQEVRCFMHQWYAISNPPCLGKVKAHDLEAVRRGDPRACGNDQVDALAKAAAQAGFVAPTHAPEDDFAYAVRVCGSDGKLACGY